MSLRFCSFASSSSGNCYLIQSSGGSSILIDAGVPLRRLEKNLLALKVAPSSLQGIFLTHAHRDHVASFLIKKPFATRYNLATYASTGTWQELLQKGCGSLDYDRCHRIAPGQTIEVGDLQVTGYAKLHDAQEALCFTVSDGQERLAVVTDLGCFTSNLLPALRGCHYYIFEANHDVEMEERSARPWVLKQRVLGQYGHLSNEQAGQALASLADAAHGVWLAHLSQECNRPELACRVVTRSLQAAGLDVPVYHLPACTPSPVYGSDGLGPARSLSLWEIAADRS